MSEQEFKAMQFSSEVLPLTVQTEISHGSPGLTPATITIYTHAHIKATAFPSVKMASFTQKNMSSYGKGNYSVMN